MTIEEEIRRRLLTHGIPEERLEECVRHVEADPLMRGMRAEWANATWVYTGQFIESIWTCAKSSAMDWLTTQLTAPVK